MAYSEDKLTPLETIQARLATKTRFMGPFSGKDQLACGRYLDSSLLLSGESSQGSAVAESENWKQNEGGELPESLLQGDHNRITTNLQVKAAGVGINRPDFYVRTNDPKNAEIVRQGFRHLWELYDWTDFGIAAEIRKGIAGHAFVAYRWDAAGYPCFDLIDSWDAAVDPHVTATQWKKLRWRAWRIRLPRDVAKRRYPKANFDDRLPLTLTPEEPSDAVRIWVYFDKTTEAHLLEGDGEQTKESELFRDKNPYGGIPALDHRGDYNPRSPWGLGDFDQASGQQALKTELGLRLTNQAKNGGALNVYDAADMTEAEKGTLQKQIAQGFVPVSGPPEDKIKRIPSEPINPALIEALDRADRAIDETTAVTPYQRGGDSGAETATEAALLANQSGSRGGQTRAKFERLLNAMARAALDMIIRFGKVDTEEEYSFWLACKDVAELRVLEGSTVYVDPAAQQQSAMQRLNLAAQVAPLAATLGAPVPMLLAEIMRLKAEVHRAFGATDVEQFLPGLEPFLQQLAQAPPQPEQAGSEDAGDPIGPISYKDAPPDIKRQMEERAGFTASQMGDWQPGNEGNGGNEGNADPREVEAAKGEREAFLQASQQQHEIAMKRMELEHKRAELRQAGLTEMAKMSHQAAMAKEAAKNAPKPAASKGKGK